MKYTIKDLLEIITTPNCWVRNYSTDKNWDNYLNILLDNYTPTASEYDDIMQYTLILGTTEVWVGNWGHAYGSKYGMHPYGEPNANLPSRKTAIRLRKVHLAATAND